MLCHLSIMWIGFKIESIKLLLSLYEVLRTELLTYLKQLKKSDKVHETLFNILNIQQSKRDDLQLMESKKGKPYNYLQIVT